MITQLRTSRAGDVVQVTRGWTLDVWHAIGDDARVGVRQSSDMEPGDVVYVLAVLCDRDAVAWLMVTSKHCKLGWMRAQHMAGDPDSEWYKFVIES